MSKSLYLPLNVGLEEAELEGFTTASQALGSRNSLEFVNNSLSTIQTFFSRMIQLDPEENELFGETGRDINGFRLTTEDEPPGLDHDTAISIRSDHISNLSIQSGKAASSAAGTATGGSATTLVDSGRSWTVDEWKDATLKIVDATDGALYFVTVTDNDATSFTFVTPGITVASSDTYQVVKNSSDCLLNMGSWNAVGGTWGVNGALRIDMSNNNAFSMESNYGKITFDNNSTTKRLTADVSNLKIQSGTQPYAEFQNMETSNPALFFFDGGSDPSTPSNGAVVYAKSGDLYRRKSDGTISAWATGGGSGTIDEAADYSMTGTWSFSPVSGKSVPSFQPYASGTPFTIGSNGFDQVVSRLNADLLDGNHASVFPQDASGVGTTIVGNWTFTPGSGGDFPLMPKNTFFNQADDGSTAPFQVTSTTVVANLESATTVMADDTKKFDGKLPGKYAILADDEIVTGDYTFEGEVDFSIEDAGKITMKSGALKIGPLAAAEAPFSLTAPYSGTIVTGLNVQYLNGSEDTAFIKPATATVAVTGNWTFNPSGTQPFTVPAGKTDLVERLNADLLDGEHAESFLTTASTDITITGNWFFNPASGGNFPNLPKQTYFSESSLAPFQVVSTAVVANLHATNSAQLGGTVADDYATDDEVDTLLISYANLSEDETVTGDYTFEGAVDFNPTLVADKITVKSGALKIGARATTEAPFTLTAPYSLTMVDGLNVQYLNGYQSSHFIRPETATVAVTGDWTFNPSGSQPFFVAAGKTDTVTNLSADTLRGSPPETFLQVATATPIITGNWTFNPTSDADFPYFGTNSNPQLPSGTKFYVADGTAPFEVTSTTAVANLTAENSTKLNDVAADLYTTDSELAAELLNYANLSQDEAVTGDYTFSGDITVAGKVGGGAAGSFTIGEPDGAEAPIILENPSRMGTVVTGLNADLVDGIHGAVLANTAETEEITNTWTFSSPPAFTQSTGTSPFTVASTTVVANLKSATSNLAADSTLLGGVAASSYPRTNNNETLTSIWQFGNASNAVPVKMAEMATPTEPAPSFGYLYHNSADNGIYWMTHNTEGDHDTNLMATDASALYSGTATSSQTTEVTFLSLAATTPNQTYQVEIRVIGRGTSGDFDDGYVVFRAYNMFYTQTSGEVFSSYTTNGNARTPSSAKDGAGVSKSVSVSGSHDFLIPILNDSGNIVVKASGYNSSSGTNNFSWKYWIKVYQV